MKLHQVINHIREEIISEYLSTAQPYPWIVGFSAGKDSTILLHLVVESLLELAPSERTRPVHVLFNDTRVESPIYMEHAERTLKRLTSALPALGLPCTVHRALPDPDQTFWVNLIGRGYPSPNRQFRWCTDRLKIAPTNDYIKSVVSKHGHAVLLLGVRRDESSTRAQSINRYKNAPGSRLNPHNSLPGCLVFRPIADLRTEDLWSFLLSTPPPWGGSHRSLVTLYRNLNAGECPLVLDKSEAPACGSSSYRFGCWTCTVVDRDRSMEAQIDAGHDWMEPLVRFRDYLHTIRNDMAYRDYERRNGQLGTGPFTLEAREEVFDNLMSLQEEVDQELITEDEVHRIKRIWSEDLIQIAQRRLGIKPKKAV